MSKSIAVALLVIVLCVAGYVAYNKFAPGRTTGNGDVFSSDGSLIKTHTEAAADSDEQPPDAAPVISHSGTPGTVNGNPLPGPGAAATTEQVSASQPSMNATSGTALPVSDTIAPNAPNALAFGGTGKFQWYRQGNLTWRLNTASGSVCIAFATNEEWQKPVVYSHGCGNA